VIGSDPPDRYVEFGHGDLQSDQTTLLPETKCCADCLIAEIERIYYLSELTDRVVLPQAFV